MTQRPNSYNLLTDKNGLKNTLDQSTDVMKKAKKSTDKLELNFP